MNRDREFGPNPVNESDRESDAKGNRDELCEEQMSTKDFLREKRRRDYARAKELRAVQKAHEKRQKQDLRAVRRRDRDAELENLITRASKLDRPVTQEK